MSKCKICNDAGFYENQKLDKIVGNHGKIGIICDCKKGKSLFDRKIIKETKKPSTVKIDYKTAWQGFFSGIQKDPRKAYTKAEILAMRDFYEDMIDE